MHTKTLISVFLFDKLGQSERKKINIFSPRESVLKSDKQMHPTDMKFRGSSANERRLRQYGYIRKLLQMIN